jgi:disulfide oxidoreductase YuzD
LVREEMGRRFGEKAVIEYVSLDESEARETYKDTIAAIEDAGLLYPVTVIEGEAVYDGSVSYPAILRQVETRLAATA